MLVAALALAFQSSPPVWIEAETGLSEAPAIQRGPWSSPARLSGGKWLSLSAEAGERDAKIPEAGVTIRHPFTLKEGGKRAIWNRIGFEFARSPFKWRVDNGPWTAVTPDDLTTDLVPLGVWQEVAWIKLGEADLKAGDHTIEILVERNKDDKGAPARTLYASDALAIAAPDWHPTGPFGNGPAPREALKGFTAPARAGDARVEVPLAGEWEVRRDDEKLPPFEIETPMVPVQKREDWSRIPVPSDRNISRPDLLFAHRLWYRTTVNVAETKGSARLSFPRNSLQTTVLVNGVLCGASYDPLVAWDVDVTKALKQGENEILVGIRDPWYAYSGSPTDPLKRRRKFNIPLEFTNGGFQDFAYPVWQAMHTGILETPVLTLTGPVAATDVFVRPSVEKKRIDADVTLHNPGPAPLAGIVSAEALDKDGKVVWRGPKESVQVAAGKTEKLTTGGPWADAELWWPDRPTMHTLRVRVETPAGTDVKDTPFGFREWSSKGKDFTLNGQVWHGWADLIGVPTRSPEEWLGVYRKTGQRFIRVAGEAQNGGYRWQGMPYARALDWMDRNGVVVRRSNVLDGERIGYMAVESDPELRKLYGGSEIKKELMKNWGRQMAAQVREERNHPSIHVWSVENEYLYINGINLYGGLMDEMEAAVKEVGDGVRKEDPTRLWMVDGGGAGRKNEFPVHGDHYVFTNRPSDYPRLAYEMFPEGGGRGRWLYDGNRPRYAGEDFYATGDAPADYAWIGGEKAFGGKTDVREAYGRVQRMLTEGYRWNGTMSHFHFWVGDEGAEFGKYKAFAERAAFVREYDASFGAGTKVRRTVGVFNDSRHPEPLTLTWAAATPDGTATGKIDVTVPPGEKRIVPLDIPIAAAKGRRDGRLTLTLSTKEKGTIFQDVKPFIVQPAPAPLAKSPVVHVYDPKGRLKGLTARTGLSATPLASLANLPKDGVVLVGPDALTQDQADRPFLAAYAAGGGRVVILDQAHPVGGPGLPFENERTDKGVSFLFPEDPTHPALLGIAELDLQGWTGGSSRNLWIKPPRGAKSLIQGGERLGRTALMEVPLGTGGLWMSQLNGDLSRAPYARLVRQLVIHAATYAPRSVPLALSADDAALKDAVAKLGAKVSPSGDLTAELAGPAKILLIQADPKRLATLTADLTKTRAFLAKGGALVLNGLGPEGLASFNKLVGADHLLRPFRREKVAMTTPRHPLTAGLSLGDVALLSAERMFDFNGDMFVARDTFSNVVDLKDVAPFGIPNNDEFLQNAVNGFVSADGWKYILSFDKPTERTPTYPLAWSSPRTLTNITWIGNGFYHKATKLELSFDGGKTKRTVDVLPNTEPQAIPLAPPVTASRLDVRIADWTREPGLGDVVGIDNVYVDQARPADFSARVRPMINVGGLVEYPVGKGRIVLANLLFKEQEEVPGNAIKKRTILATILRNLGAPFSDGRAIVAGARGLVVEPVNFAGVANLFRDSKGPYGDAARNLGDIPTGRQTFGDVNFDVYRFVTSPVPDAISLPDGVNGVTLPIKRKAAALFLLQTARVDRGLDDRERRENQRPEIARYVVTYADGTSVNVPILLGGDVDDFRQKSPRALPGAALGWAKKFAAGEESATAWVRQWTNPRPEAEIASIRLERSGENRALPILLAVSTAR